MTMFWQVMMVLIFLYVVFFIPLAIFHYEAFDEVEIRGKRTDCRGACRSAVFYEIMVLVVTFLVLGLMFAFLGTAKVPLTELEVDAVSTNALIVQAVNFSTTEGREAFVGTTSALSAATECLSGCVSTSDDTLSIDTSFATYIAGFTGWVGWFVFVVFGGVGLASVPITLIGKYIDRPKLRTPKELEEMRSALQKRTSDLLRLGTDIQEERTEWSSRKHSWRENRKKNIADRTNINKFKQMVYLLEKDYDDWNISSKNVDDYNPLMPYISLFMGIIAAIVSILWVVQIIVYILIDPPASQFLNAYFIQYESWFPLFGTLSVAIFAFYLLVCVIYGLFKLGVRCFCITLHPMEYGKTLMNAFLFNILWIMLCAIPVVQFCLEAFDGYARYTTIGTLLGVQVKYLQFFRYFFEDNVFVYMLLIIAGLSGLYLLFRSKDQPPSAENIKSKRPGRRR